MAKITKRFVDALVPGNRDNFAWDTELRGFGVRLKPSGALSYIVQYRNTLGRSRRLTIGSHGRLTPDEARKEAKRILGEVERNKDPAAERADARSAPTMEALCERFLVEYAREHKKPRSVETDESNIRNHVVPLVGHLKVVGVTRADIDRFKLSVKDGKTARVEKLGPRSKVIVTGGPGAANRCLALLSKMFNEAEKWGLRPEGSNPCRHVAKYRERKLERYLTAEELACLGTVLVEAEQQGIESKNAVAAIRLLLFTGCRLSEILTLKWDWVDFEGGCLRLPDSKTGAKVIYLPAPALSVLSAIPRIDGNPYVLPGEVPGQHIVNIQKAWRRIRERATVTLWRGSDEPRLTSLIASLERESELAPTFAQLCKAAHFDLPTGLTDVRLHDLRHSFASVAVATGEGLHMIGKLLGHTQAQTTHRYAHLAADPMKAAADRVGTAIEAAMSSGGGEVIDMKHDRQRQ